MLATHCMVVVTLSGCLLCSDSPPAPHPPQNPFPSSNRGLVSVVWIMFWRVGGVLIWPWGTVGVLYCCFWGIMRNFRPWRWTIVGPLQCCLKKDGSLDGLCWLFQGEQDEEQHKAGFFTFGSTGCPCPSNLKYLVKLVLVYLNGCAKRDCQMLWLL